MPCFCLLLINVVVEHDDKHQRQTSTTMTMTFSLLMMVMMLLHVATLFWTTDWWFARKALKIQEREFGSGHRLLVAVLEPKSVVALNAYHPYIIVIVIDVHKPSILRFWKLPSSFRKAARHFCISLQAGPWPQRPLQCGALLKHFVRTAGCSLGHEGHFGVCAMQMYRLYRAPCRD